MLIRKFVRRMNGSQRKIPHGKISEKEANLEPQEVPFLFILLMKKSVGVLFAYGFKRKSSNVLWLHKYFPISILPLGRP